MKASVGLLSSDMVVAVSGGSCGVATISSKHENFRVIIEEIEKREEIKQIIVEPGGKVPSIDFLRTDGWEIQIGEQAYEGENMVITRFYRKPNGDIDWNDEQYLAKSGKWEKKPKSGPLPKNAVRIPLLVLEKEKTKV